MSTRESKQADALCTAVTRGDVLFILDAILAYPLVQGDSLRAQLARATIEDFADALRERWAPAPPEGIAPEDQGRLFVPGLAE